MICLLSSVFTGNYAFSRYVSSPKIHMKGRASFRIISSTLKHYYEEGSYVWEGNSRAFYQNQFFVIQENQLLILKGEKNLLHKFNLTKRSSLPIHLNHMHQCKDDQYVLDLWIQSQDKLFTSYRILGPNKKYSIKTKFWRSIYSP